MDVSHCNPCCCITLRSGATISAGVDMVYSLGYIVRVYCLFWMVGKYENYYPDTPAHYKNNFLRTLFTYGSYSMAAASSLILLIAILALPLRLQPYLCYMWLTSRVVIVFIHGFHAHHLLVSYIPLFVSFGYEVASTLFLHAYLSFVIFNFSKDAYDENVAKRKIAAATEEDPTPQHQKSLHESTPSKANQDNNSVNNKKKVAPSALETSAFLAKRKAKFTHHRSSLDHITNVLYENSNPTLFISILSLKKDAAAADDDDDDDDIDDEYPIGDEDDSSWDDISTHSIFARFATARKITNASLDSSQVNSQTTAVIDLGMDNVVSSQFENYTNSRGGSLSVFGDSSNILSQLLKAKPTTNQHNNKSNHKQK